MSDLVILYSGGADSRLMLEMAKSAGYSPLCILIDYGQVHVRELEVAEKHLRELGGPFKRIDISSFRVKSGLTSGDGNESGEVHEMHVPGRNSIFLSLAFSIAEEKEIDLIWYGADWSDRLNLFPDCYQEYVFRMNEAFKFAGPKPIEVQAPLLGMSKELILAILSNTYGVDQVDLYSGYGGLENIPRKVEEE